VAAAMPSIRSLRGGMLTSCTELPIGMCPVSHEAGKCSDGDIPSKSCAARTSPRIRSATLSAGRRIPDQRMKKRIQYAYTFQSINGSADNVNVREPDPASAVCGVMLLSICLYCINYQYKQVQSMFMRFSRATC
jgi:hypothetical protein